MLLAGAVLPKAIIVFRIFHPALTAWLCVILPIPRARTVSVAAHGNAAAAILLEPAVMLRSARPSTAVVFFVTLGVSMLLL